MPRSQYTVRSASHAGSWYEKDGTKLDGQLSEWLQNAKESKVSFAPAKAIIAPHAGFSYSGRTAAFAYAQIDVSSVQRVFLFGPSHHFHLDGCALSMAQEYATPLGNIPVDQSVTNELRSTNLFEDMSKSTDEEEHSLEMHLPYIAKVMESKKGQYTLVPVLVGNISEEQESPYAKIFGPYFKDTSSLFVVSSDFCHWGRRFDFTHHEPSWGEIHQSIERLDKMGMDIIEQLDPKEFRSYLSRYKNTICRRNPIILLLAIVERLRKGSSPPKIALKFIRYAQSSPCKTTQDSSVSYASASLLYNME